GGAVRDALPVLWTLASGDASRDVDEARALIEARRHKVFKLKIGSQPLADDIAHVQAIRRGLGDDVMLTVDVNQAWDEPTAVRGIAALEAAGIGLIEQPVARRNRRALARLAARFDVAVQRPQYRDFELQVPQTPGLGVQLDADKFAFYRRDRASQSVAVTA